MKALVLGAVTTAWSGAVVPRLALSDRRRAVVNAAFGVSLVAVTRAPLGLKNWRSGLVWGLGAAAVPVAASAVVASVPSLVQRVRPSGDDLAEWVLFRIPIGTVLTEELTFRAVLDAASPGSSPIFFGLWHIHPARAAGDSVALTVVGTFFAGVLFSWLRRRSGSVLAPMMLHYAVNASGAILAVRARDVVAR